MYMYVMCPREAYEMDVRMSCDLCHVTCGVT